MRTIHVLNPNSNTEVTAAMSAALDPLRLPGGPVIECATLAEGPLGIESDADVARVAPLVVEKAAGCRADAFVIACYSDPGIDQARHQADIPVFGIARSALLKGLALGSRLGVISILETSIPRHMAYAERIGIKDKIAGDRAVGLHVEDIAAGEEAEGRLADVGRTLKDQDGADVLILGCAGMAPYRAGLEDTLGIPVIDPCQAAVADALGSVLLTS